MALTSCIARKVANYSDPKSLGSRLRAKRLKPLLSMITNVHATKGSVKILDLGGTKTYWSMFPEEVLGKYNVCIYLLNLPSSFKHEDEERFKYLEGDACGLPDFDDGSFDIVHSNSVIEHVGDWEKMLQFAGEVKRLARNYYIQVPNYWFPIEPHFMTPFFHWLPKPIKVSLTMRFSLGHKSRQTTVSDAVRTVERTRLPDKKMFQALFEDAEIKTEWLLGLPKSLIAIRTGGIQPCDSTL